MLISHSHQYIFIHNYKVAGTSVHSALKSTASISPPFFRKLRKEKPTVYTNDFAAHCKAAEVKEKISPEIYSAYFKFGFVRNPWDWQVSLYKYMLQNKGHHQHQLIKGLGSFDKYLDWRIHEDLHLQKEFFYDKDGKLIVDFIGKFESLAADFQKICDTIGVRASLPHLKRSNNSKSLIKKYSQEIENVGYKIYNRLSQKANVQKSLPALNQTKQHNGYLKYYSQKSIDLVAEAFQEDIETFEYTQPKLQQESINTP